MKTQHAIALTVVLLFTLYFLYIEIKHRRFHNRMKIGDLCSIYLESDRINCTIYHIEGDVISMYDAFSNYYSRQRDEVNLAYNPLFYII